MCWPLFPFFWLVQMSFRPNQDIFGYDLLFVPTLAHYRALWTGAFPASFVNSLITSVGDGSAWNNTLPYVFLITDGAQDPQIKGVPNGSWSGSNHATVIDPSTSCTPLKNRGPIESAHTWPVRST